jgi:hypothetical protein
MTIHVTIIEVRMLPDGRMDRKNAGLYLGKSAKGLAMDACKGTGPRFVKLGGRAWYFKSDLEEWKRQNGAVSAAAAATIAIANIVGRRRNRIKQKDSDQ